MLVVVQLSEHAIVILYKDYYNHLMKPFEEIDKLLQTKNKPLKNFPSDIVSDLT